MVGTAKDPSELATYRKVSLLACAIIFVTVTSLLILNIVLYRITIVWILILYIKFSISSIKYYEYIVGWYYWDQILPLSLRIDTTTSPMTAKMTKTIKNCVHLFIIALRIIIWSPFFAFFILILNYLFSSSNLSRSAICFSSSSRI